MQLRRRYLFRGKLALNTALHIGGGDATLGVTDSPVLRTATGQPFIPGSSLKGAFRSTVDKLAATLALPRCELDALDPKFQQRFNDKRRNTGSAWDDEQTMREALADFPVTVQLFGTTFFASKIFFNDLYLITDEGLGAAGVIERRDGVAIDRDSERAMDGLKYDFEVVAPSQAFSCEIRLEDPGELDLQLACLGVSELANGFISLGGKRSRGLGQCQLQDLAIHTLDLTGNDRSIRLRNYLTGQNLDAKMPLERDPNAFLQKHIDALLKDVERKQAANANGGR